mmetsp:Transcript_51736/g.109991  ORF Transcript_51736/g.109991 Transcript_51736/m.109991 type:complete len:375 (-) Transcript_51736:124-1248(-)
MKIAIGQEAKHLSEQRARARMACALLQLPRRDYLAAVLSVRKQENVYHFIQQGVGVRSKAFRLQFEHHLHRLHDGRLLVRTAPTLVHRRGSPLLLFLLLLALQLAPARGRQNARVPFSCRDALLIGTRTGKRLHEFRSREDTERRPQHVAAAHVDGQLCRELFQFLHGPHEELGQGARHCDRPAAFVRVLEQAPVRILDDQPALALVPLAVVELVEVLLALRRRAPQRRLRDVTPEAVGGQEHPVGAQARQYRALGHEGVAAADAYQRLDLLGRDLLAGQRGDLAEDGGKGGVGGAQHRGILRRLLFPSIFVATAAASLALPKVRDVFPGLLGGDVFVEGQPGEIGDRFRAGTARPSVLAVVRFFHHLMPFATG